MIGKPCATCRQPVHRARDCTPSPPSRKSESSPRFRPSAFFMFSPSSSAPSPQRRKSCNHTPPSGAPRGWTPDSTGNWEPLPPQGSSSCRAYTPCHGSPDAGGRHDRHRYRNPQGSCSSFPFQSGGTILHPPRPLQRRFPCRNAGGPPAWKNTIKTNVFRNLMPPAGALPGVRHPAAPGGWESGREATGEKTFPLRNGLRMGLEMRKKRA